MRFAVLSDIHLAPPGTPDGTWNNVTRLSVSGDLLAAAAADIVAAGHDRVLLLGDVSQFGDQQTIAAALRVTSGAGLRSWAVPGNHDVIKTPEVLAAAVEGVAGSHGLPGSPASGADGQIALHGPGLRSGDGGQTCQATHLPDLTKVRARLLLWASHYPALSQHSRIEGAGLRYSGDLLNRADVSSGLLRFSNPVLVLHGHLHCAIVAQAGSVLQIGVPAVVEWPHAWTDVSIDVTDMAISVRTALHPIPGSWSADGVNSVLADREQNWVHDSGRWITA